ncbi:MAG: ADP-ribosylglycohydrolase family protein, partial [Clostridiales bacterium]|nr:ADP-ribosylglycohydrolase family protein [Clostridiales bacterium]
MRTLTDRDLEKIYFGWLGKMIGIRYGAPVEMWSSEEIVQKYGGKDGYFVDYNDFAADDDSNGPIFFFRALEECKDVSKYGFEDMANCWKNYVPFEHGFYWWGGYGVSEEHTAYLNIQKGIMPPVSGSIVQNGKVLAEQIGGQIFSDVWGLVSPYDYREAARLAEIASRVSHDGVAVDGGRFIAALISAAFGAESIKELLETALGVIDRSSLYAVLVRDLMHFHASGKSAEECFAHIRKNYWKDKYGGNCHIIPNAAIIIYSLLYGEGDFIKTLKIANYSGFDTDCNVGNLGTVMGVFTELKGVDYDTWIAPIRDTALCSSALGYANIVNIPTFAYRIFRTALRFRGEEYTGKYADRVYADHGEWELDFLLPQSVSGMRAEGATVKNSGNLLDIMPKNNECTVLCKTYYGKNDLFDNRYDPAFSPIAYRGQTITANYTSERNTKVRLFYEDGHTGTRYYSKVGDTQLKIEGAQDALISKIGLAIEGDGEVQLKSLGWKGKVDYTIDFSKEHMEEYALEHREVSGCTYYRGVWELEDGELAGRCLDGGELFTGKPMGDMQFETRLTCVKGDDFGILLGVQGAGRQTRLVFE